MKNENGRWTRASLSGRAIGLPLVGWLLLAAVATGLPACEEKKSRFGEAVEEVEDEAKDAKDAIKDEIDDHT